MKRDGTMGPFPLSPQEQELEPLCLWRGLNGATASASSSIGLKNCSAADTENHRRVQFALVRYRAVSEPPTTTREIEIAPSLRKAPSSAKESVDVRPESAVNVGDDEEEEEQPDNNHNTPTTTHGANGSSYLYHLHIPSSNDKAHAQANKPSPLHTKMQLNSQKKKQNRRPLSVLHDTNPILLMGGTSERQRQKDPTKLDSVAEEISSSPSLSPYNNVVRKIEVHPYIAAAKNEVWKDPQTNLEYFTDLCKYLGRNRKEYGRQTLMGVGQYRKYVIKVYGVGFYVSKRDALAEPALQRYAGLSADELRKRPDFYTLLMASHKEMRVDRTLLLKTNMQLTTETMRSSLQADWQYLTAEAKETLISSSMQGVPADAAMLKTISSPDNPSRCSCSQIAPDEYQADPECCARGTELAFTWLKNGDIEVCGSVL